MASSHQRQAALRSSTRFDLEVVAVVAEEDAVILRPQPDQQRRDSLELLGRALTGEDLAAKRFENLDGDRLLDVRTSALA